MLRWLQSKLRIAASQASVAVGRDIRDSSIQIGLDEEQTADLLRRELQPLAEQVAREKGVDVEPLRAVLAKLGEHGVANQDIHARLVRAADELIDLRQRVEHLERDEPEFGALLRDASNLIASGDLQKANALLLRGQTKARAAREHSTRSEAEFLASQAQIDSLQLSYAAAAGKYSAAAALVADQPGLAFDYLMKAARSLTSQVEELGDATIASKAIEQWRQIMERHPFEEFPEEYRKAENDLGAALAAAAHHENDSSSIDEAIALFRTIAERDHREGRPSDWARAQTNLGSALIILGERQSTNDTLQQAAEVFFDALTVYQKRGRAHFLVRSHE